MFLTLPVSKPRTADCYCPHPSPYNLIYDFCREFDKESFDSTLGFRERPGNNENRSLLILGWKGMSSDFKNLTIEKSIKSYVPLSIQFLKTFVVRILKLLCLIISEVIIAMDHQCMSSSIYVCIQKKSIAMQRSAFKLDLFKWSKTCVRSFLFHNLIFGYSSSARRLNMMMWAIKTRGN